MLALFHLTTYKINQGLILTSKMTQNGEMWIDKTQAAQLTGKGIRTIERWIASNRDKTTHVDEASNINTEELKKDYNFVINPSKSPNDEKQKIEAIRLANEQTSLTTIGDQLKNQKDIIDTLQKEKWSVFKWLSCSFVVTLVAVLVSLWYLFDAYRKEQNKEHQIQIENLTKVYQQDLEQRDEFHYSINNYQRREAKNLRKQLKEAKERNKMLTKELNSEKTTN